MNVDPNLNFYDPNAYVPVSSSAYLSRNDHGLEVILEGIKREASMMELYRYLANAAPNQKHRQEMLQALERKNVHWNYLSNLYLQLTGLQPVYNLEPYSFQDYWEGLQKAYEAELRGQQGYQQSSALIQHPHVRQVFEWVIASEQDNISRIEFLRGETLERRTDYGKQPFVVNITEAAKRNQTFRTALWTGQYLQVTLMSIDVGDEIGLETHPNLDQFLRVEQGQGLMQMGDRSDQLDVQQRVYPGYAIMIPAGKWHNLINTGNHALKIYSIYAPPEHPFGTVHKTKADALAAEHDHHSI